MEVPCRANVGVRSSSILKQGFSSLRQPLRQNANGLKPSDRPVLQASKLSGFFQQPSVSRKTSLRAVSEAAVDTVPKPVVKIDNQSDPFATVVTIKFGERLGELLDTIAALRNLGLNIRRAKIKTADGAAPNKFYITEAGTSDKVVKSARLEEIRLTILNNLIFYHPESADELAWGRPKKAASSGRDPLTPLGVRNRQVITTTIQVSETESGSSSLVEIETTDRPGLLVDIVHTLKDLNVNVVSAEVDTEGSRAKDYFFVTYHGDPLPPSMVTLVQNALQYYLSLAEIEREESY